MVFSGENRFLYEHVLIGIYESCFGADLLFPSRNELVGIVYDTLAKRPDLWHDEGQLVTLDDVSTKGRRLRPRHRASGDADATSEAMARSRHIYARLTQTGWLEESRYGLRVTVDMPAGAMRLAEFLSSLRDGPSEQLGGLVIEVKNALDGVRTSAAQNALGLHKAARDAVAFGRYLRSVLSALREIDRQVLASENLNERLQRYFQDFVEQVLLKDYAVIATTAHPYRFRYAIFDAIQALEDSSVDLESLTKAYAEAHLAGTDDGARELVFEDLDRIRRVFQRIDEAFQRIQQHRIQLEVRLRNTVRYAGRRADAYLRRSQEIVAGLDRIAAHSSSTVTPAVLGHLELVRSPFSSALLARPRGERPPVEVSALALETAEPIHQLRRQLERDYIARITVTPQQVLDFLDRRIDGGGTSAAELAIDDLDDFLAFETLRRSVRSVAKGKPDDELARQLVGRYVFEHADGGRIDNDWIACKDFSIRRSDPAPSPGGVRNAG
jgi:hypothetical protein